MYKNKILYRPRTADLSTLTTDNLLTLANIITTSRSTTPPQPKDLRPQRLYVLDGTLVPCWWWKNARNLYSGKHHKAGHNLQVLVDQAGEIFYISEPLPGSTHDITAIRNTGLFGYIQPWHHAADIRVCGVRVRHTVEEKTQETTAGVTATIQQKNQPDPVCYRTIHSPYENLADTIYPL